MAVIEKVLSNIFNRIKCEKLVKYQGRTFEMKSVGVEAVPVKVNFDGLKTKLVKLTDATEISRQIDDFQYTMCGLAKELGKGHPEFVKFWKLRAAGIFLLHNFGSNLVAFERDPTIFEDNLKKSLNDMRKFVNKVVFKDILGIESGKRSKVSSSHQKMGIPLHRSPPIYWARPMDFKAGQPVPLYKHSLIKKLSPRTTKSVTEFVKNKKIVKPTFILKSIDVENALKISGLEAVNFEKIIH